jgi:hypothetical protein
MEMLGDPEKWKKAQRSALSRVDRYYRQESFLEKYRNIYKEVS